MSNECIVRAALPPKPHQKLPTSTFTPPVHIEMGDEGGEYLETLVEERTGETVKADEDWTPLSGTRYIDTSVVGGFMFQVDAGKGCLIQVTEKGKIPAQISIDEKQEFAMFLVVIRRHEEWMTFGNFHLRFLRRVPVLDKRCTARRMDGPFAGPIPSPSDSDTSSTEEPDSSTNELEEQRTNDRATGTDDSPPTRIPSIISFALARRVTLASQTGSSENNEEMTDEEGHHKIGRAELKGTEGGIVPPGTCPPL